MLACPAEQIQGVVTDQCNHRSLEKERALSKHLFGTHIRSCPKRVANEVDNGLLQCPRHKFEDYGVPP